MFGGLPLKNYLENKKVCVVASKLGVTPPAIRQARDLGNTFVFQNDDGQLKAFIIKELGGTKRKKQK